jgi:hypothetical protein
MHTSARTLIQRSVIRTDRLVITPVCILHAGEDVRLGLRG